MNKNWLFLIIREIHQMSEWVLGFFLTDVKCKWSTPRNGFFFTFDDVICYPARAALLFPQRNFIFLCSISIETNYYLKKKKNPKNFFWLLFYLSGSCFFSTCVYYVKLIITGCLSFLLNDILRGNDFNSPAPIMFLVILIFN
jgi:hypothetical protein